MNDEPCTLEDSRVAVATTCYLDEDGDPGDFLDERDIWVDTNPDMISGTYWCVACDKYFKGADEALDHLKAQEVVA